MEAGEAQNPDISKLKPQTQVMERPGVNGEDNLKGRFDNKAEEETEKGFSNIRIEVRLGKHGSAEDAEGLGEKFKHCKIFFPETFGWLPSHLDALLKLSIGSITPGIALQRWIYKDKRSLTRDKKFFEMIHRSNKYIAFLDVPADADLVKREDNNKFPNIQSESDFGQVIDSVREYIEEDGDIQLERESYIVGQLNPQIQKILEEHQELKKEPDVDVLIDIGAGHKFLPGKLGEKYGITVFDKDEAFLYSEEARIKYMRPLESGENEQARDRRLDDYLIARIAAEWTLLREYPDRFQTENAENDAIKLKKQISGFTFDELKDTFGKANSRQEWADLIMTSAEEQAKLPAAVK